MTQTSPTPTSNHQVVIAGASMAGLFAAAALSEYFEEIVLLDHAEIPDEPKPRRGAGQTYHSHVLMDDGIEAIENLFPGALDEVSKMGNQITDGGADLRWHQQGRWKPSAEADVRFLWCERARLEWVIRQRVREISNIETIPNQKVVDYISSDDGEQIEGVLTRKRRGEPTQRWNADLVVDAMGRGTRTPRLLEKMGHPKSQMHSYDVNLGYTSCKVTSPASFDGSWQTLAIYPKIPETTKMGLAYPIGEDRFQITLGGWCGDHPPADDVGFKAFARSLPKLEIAQILDETERLTKLRRYRVPEAYWRRYDKVSSWPGGLIVLGDALCSFNPVYGQGMTVAANQAVALRQQLEKAGPPRKSEQGENKFERSFQQKAAGIIRTPWLISATQDYQYPQVSGDQWLPEKLGGVVKMLVDASGQSAQVHRAFLEVISMKKPLARALDPRIAARAMMANLRN